MNVLTEKEIEIEKTYRREERHGIITQGLREPTLSERFAAQEEADEWERHYRAEGFGV
jgi:bisphosphoglycerate-dependent phosphoglycerate mutase